MPMTFMDALMIRKLRFELISATYLGMKDGAGHLGGRLLYSDTLRNDSIIFQVPPCVKAGLIILLAMRVHVQQTEPIHSPLHCCILQVHLLLQPHGY